MTYYLIADTTPPTVTSIVRSSPTAQTTNSDSLSWAVTFSESVTNVSTDGSDFTVSGPTGVSLAVSGSGASYTVTATGSNLASYEGTVSLALASGQDIQDAASNALTNTTPTGTVETYTLDNTAPTVTSVGVPSNATYSSGQNLDFTVNFSENITVNTAGGTPQIALTIGSTTRQASYQSGSGTSALTFRYTVQAGDEDTDGIAVGTLAANGGTLRDAGGNDANLTLNSVGATTAVLVDAVAPTVTSLDVPSNGTYGTGQNLDFTVNFSENITVDTSGGTPKIAVYIGSNVRTAYYQSGSGTNALLFRYTVEAGEEDSDGIFVVTAATGDATMRDPVGNDANFSITNTGVNLLPGVLVDGTRETVSSVGVPANGTYIQGQDLTFTVNFSGTITVTGTPQLNLTIGSANVTADYVSGSGSSALTFTYTVQAGDTDSDGIAVTSLSANGGTLRGGNNKDATLTLNSVGALTAVLVDTTAPTLSQVTAVPTQSNDNTPNYTFSTNDTGTLSVGGSCGTSTSTTISSTGNQTITLTQTDNSSALSDGTYADCTVTVTDAAGNASTALAINSFSVDTTAPTVALSSSAGATVYGPFDVTVTLSEATANLIADDFTVSNGSVTLANVSPTVYTLSVTPSGGSPVTVNLDAATFSDAAGNDNTAAPTGITRTYVADSTAPTLTSIVRSNPTVELTNYNEVRFAVTFNEAMGTISASDFTVSGTSGTVSGVTNPSGNVYNVTVSGGDLASFNGVVGVSLASGHAITDVAGNALVNTTPSGSVETFTLDNTQAVFQSLVRHTPNTATTPADTLTWRLTFSEDVKTFGQSGLTANTFGYTASGLTGASFAVNRVSTGVYDVTLSGGNLASFEGTVRIGFEVCQEPYDLAGNDLTSYTPSGANEHTYTVSQDTTAPTVAISSSAADPVSGTFDVTITFSEAVSGFDVT
ncbi:beta strand repeat-containing protein, partial [Woodsholea maritima]|uniref:beta strand repeat-containing protein n=1 Tax=Woodsholea maritima TaxID=240237 RepID=UPI001F417D2C